MNLQSQIVSLELAKRLKELGVKKDSYFVWFKLKENNYYSLSESWQIDDEDRFDTLSAFTVAELGEMLPAILNKIYYFTSVKLDENHHWGADYRNWKDNEAYCFADTESEIEADARAKMLIYLIENGLMKNESAHTGHS